MRIEPGHAYRNDAREDSDVLEVSTPHLDDVVRLVDNYGREGTNSPYCGLPALNFYAWTDTVRKHFQSHHTHQTRHFQPQQFHRCAVLSP